MGTLAGYFWSEALCQRQTGVLCPETAMRCEALEPNGIFARAGVNGQHFTFTTRGGGILDPVHEPDYIEKVRTAHSRQRMYLDSGDTVVTPDVFDQALLAASAGCDAVDRIFAGEIAAAFCAIRPPGHHANRLRALGFCVFNNAAIAAEYAKRRHGVERVMTVDWDVHPGNGTQEIFWKDPAVFTLSIHQADLFSDAGGDDLVGEEAGRGFNRNIPVAPGTPAAEYIALFRSAVEHSARKFRPELLIISAGFDSHARDPASSLLLQEEHFGELTRIAYEATVPFTGGKTLSLLEGGYNIGALQGSAAEHYRALWNCTGG